MLRLLPTLKNSININAFPIIPTLTFKRFKHDPKLTEIRFCDGVRTITLMDTKTRNSLSMPMMESLNDCINTELDDMKLRVIVIASLGDVWSSGHNLHELAEAKCPEAQKQVFNKLTEVIKSIQKCPVPVIAKVKGLAAAAGCQLAASCDMVVASNKASFSTPGANFGIFCSTPGVAISRVMSRTKAAHMLMTGLPLDAEDAFLAGLVSTVVNENDLDKEVCRINNAIKQKSRAVVTFGKDFYYKQLSLKADCAFEQAEKAMVENLQLADGKEGLQSFVEKRRPQWKHKK